MYAITSPLMSHITPQEKQKKTRWYKHIIYIFIFRRRRVWRRNTARESSHISFFCCGDPFCEVMWRLENTYDMWLAGISLRFRAQLTSPLCLSEQRPLIMASLFVPLQEVYLPSFLQSTVNRSPISLIANECLFFFFFQNVSLQKHGSYAAIISLFLRIPTTTTQH